MSEDKTTKQWWQQTKSDPQKLEDWLFDQYRGEATAAARIEQLRDTFAREDPRAARLLTVIAKQERLHARWVGALLIARGRSPVVSNKTERYWPKAIAAIDSLETGCAVGAHAERMRLQRIEEIAKDPDAPADVRAVFARILPQERFHERAFASLSNEQALEATKDDHALGRRALGLNP